VTGLSRTYYAQRQAIGNRWFMRGVADLQAKKFDAAATEFRAALLYSRDDYSYQLNLAEALIGLGHSGEASAYLMNLWDREPENGVVNLGLARIAGQQGRTQDAVRYYHDAVYAVWPNDQESKRRDARLELIELLLRMHEPAEAQAELIALAENMGDDPNGQEHIGDVFMRAGDFAHALAAYRVALKADHRNPTALAGAGSAAFELGQFPLAEHYLQAALAVRPNDSASSDLLKTTETVLHIDPFRRQIPAQQRDKNIVLAFNAAGQRLKACPLPNGNTGEPAGSLESLSNEWATLKRRVNVEELRRDANLPEQAMDLVFRIERETSIVCGTPSGTDLALLLISKLHEGNQ
jgi:tetratricopeptide (TPR) repeat protein